MRLFFFEKGIGWSLLELILPQAKTATIAEQKKRSEAGKTSSNAGAFKNY